MSTSTAADQNESMASQDYEHSVPATKAEKEGKLVRHRPQDTTLYSRKIRLFAGAESQDLGVRF